MTDLTTCHECGGEGSREQPHPFWDDPFYCDVIPCAECHGSGWVAGRAAPVEMEDRDDEPCLSRDEQKAQAQRCPCGGADDFCPCQNVADRQTRAKRKATRSSA